MTPSSAVGEISPGSAPPNGELIERSRRRVLLVTDVTGPGGVSTHLLQLAEFGRSAGWEVGVLMDDCPGIATTARALLQRKFVVQLGSVYHGYHDEETIRATILSGLGRFRPEVVHVHCGSPRSAVLPRELSLDAGLPLIVTEHFVPPDLALDDAQRARLAAIYRRAAIVISVCDENRRLLRERYSLWTDRHFVVRYGVHAPPIDGRPDEGGTVRAITVARFVSQKGIDVLVRAVAQLQSDIRNSATFTVVGGGPLEDELRQLAKELGVSEQIRFIGWCDDIPARLRSHDLFILPSRSEGQPIALLEALAAGLPCIASAVSGIPEALGDGRYGRLVPPDDPASLAQAIELFASARADLSAKAAAASNHLRNCHDLATNLGEVVGLWRAVARQIGPDE